MNSVEKVAPGHSHQLAQLDSVLCCDICSAAQLTYLAILAAGYYMYNTHLFVYLGSNPWVPVYHM